MSGPNFEVAAVRAAVAQLESGGLPARLMIDASHGNSAKDETRQKNVVETAAKQIRSGDRSIRALMVESNLVGGRQDTGKGPLVHGKSITDACLSFPDTERLVLDLANSLAG